MLPPALISAFDPIEAVILGLTVALERDAPMPTAPTLTPNVSARILGVAAAVTLMFLDNLTYAELPIHASITVLTST